jgi:hypothetical protein
MRRIQTSLRPNKASSFFIFFGPGAGQTAHIRVGCACPSPQRRIDLECREP